MRFSISVFLVSLVWLHAAASAGDRLNIRWITSEDNASHWLGCYGNADAKTPRLDALAQRGVLFRHAYSNAPVCAVARCMILHGVYSPSLGTQHMRSRHQIPSAFAWPSASPKRAGLSNRPARRDFLRSPPAIL